MAAANKVRAALGPGIQERRTEQVGSTVSKELINSAIWAIVLTNLVIFIYIWFRFEWQFALGAVVSLIHDVMFTIGIFSLFRLDFDLTIVAALLTILGYSINDTVVIYDRIRENLRRYKRMPLGDLLDLSVNETMSRTIMTVGTVFMALIALYFFGGEVIRGFTFAMLFGMLVGTYSSVFIAAPFLILIGVKRDWSGLEKGKAASAKTPDRREATASGNRVDELESTDARPDETLKPVETTMKPASQVTSPKSAAIVGSAGGRAPSPKGKPPAGPSRTSSGRSRGQAKAGGRSKRRG
jgi:preprotein translocase SecF subunit